MQLMLEDEETETSVALILVSPEWRSRAVRLDTKFDPVITVDTIVPASASSGSIALIEGFSVDAAVVVAAVAVVVVAALVVAAVATVVTVVGAAVGTDSADTCAIFTVYTRSIPSRFIVSVEELVRYPYDPSAFL